jgi:hypothetical protein
MVGWSLRETRAEIRHTRGARRLASAAVLFLLSPVVVLVVLAASGSVEMGRSASGTFLLPALTAGPAIGALLALAAAICAMPRGLGDETMFTANAGSLRVVGQRRVYDLRREELARGRRIHDGVCIEDVYGRELRAPMRPRDARRLLDDLALGPSHHRHEWVLRSPPPLVRSCLALLGGPVLVFVAMAVVVRADAVIAGASGVMVGVVTLALLATWLVRSALTRRLSVGIDGIHLASRRRAQTLRYADVETRTELRAWLDARLGHRDLAVLEDVSLDDETIAAPANPRLDLGLGDATLAVEVRLRAVDAYDRARAYVVAPTMPTPPPEGGAYRVAEVRDRAALEAMRAVLESPLSSESARLEAAIAIAEDASERPRVSAIAEAVASPTLRARLLEIARAGASAPR